MDGDIDIYRTVLGPNPALSVSHRPSYTALEMRANLKYFLFLPLSLRYSVIADCRRSRRSSRPHTFFLARAIDYGLHLEVTAGLSCTVYVRTKETDVGLIGFSCLAEWCGSPAAGTAGLSARPQLNYEYRTINTASDYFPTAACHSEATSTLLLW